MTSKTNLSNRWHRFTLNWWCSLVICIALSLTSAEIHLILSGEFQLKQIKPSLFRYWSASLHSPSWWLYKKDSTDYTPLTSFCSTQQHSKVWLNWIKICRVRSSLRSTNGPIKSSTLKQLLRVFLAASRMSASRWKYRHLSRTRG